MTGWFWLWMGCQVPCEERLPGVERDRCTYEQVLAAPVDHGDQVMAKLMSIQDPIVRGAAATRWVGQHARTLDPALGRALCGTLEGPDQGQCLRRLESAHLQR
jgi:hypothetical protein